ncbi:MAG: hypothetical protein ABEJ76_08540 [Halanaeroarchaeum sp.]
MIDGSTRSNGLVTAERDRWNPTPSARLVAGVLALLPALAILIVRVGINAPVGGAFPYGRVYEPVQVAALLGPAVGALVLSIGTDDGVIRVALAFAGAFGLLVGVGPPAAVPAAVAILGASILVAMAAVDRPLSPDDAAVTTVLGLFVVGVVLSMGAYVGVAPGTTRSLGSLFALLAVAGSPVFVGWTRPAVLVGALVAAAFAGFGVAAPFAMGAASLIAGGAVGVSLLVLVLAVFGGVALVTAGVHRGEVSAAIGGATVLAAGVPATVPRGLALVVGLAILIDGWREQ